MKRKLVLTAICFCLLAGCGKTDASNAVSNEEAQENQTSSQATEAEEVDEEKVAAEIQTKIDEIAEENLPLEEEMKKVTELADVYNKELESAEAQVDMNILSANIVDVWESEMDSLYARFVEESASNKDKVETEQIEWKSLKDEISAQVASKDGSMAPMINNNRDARFYSDRCNVLAKSLAEVRGVDYKLPELFDKDGIAQEISFAGEGDFIDIQSGMEDGSYNIVYVKNESKIEILTCEPKIDGNTISFANEDESIEGTLTYDWDGATLNFTKCEDENYKERIKVGEKIQFTKVL